MGRAMESECACNLDGGIAGGRDGSLIAPGHEGHIGKARLNES